MQNTNQKNQSNPKTENFSIEEAKEAYIKEFLSLKEEPFTFWLGYSVREVFRRSRVSDSFIFILSFFVNIVILLFSPIVVPAFAIYLRYSYNKSLKKYEEKTKKETEKDSV